MNNVVSILLSWYSQISFACVDYSRSDDNIDAVFDNFKEAYKYQEYYKEFHDYEIVPFFRTDNKIVNNG